MAEALVICDQVITEAISNKKSLIGIFNALGAIKFPVQHPKLCIYAAMTNGRGTMQADIRCIRMDDNQQIMQAAGPLEFADPNQVVELVVTLNNLPFERPGLYTFELSCDGGLLMEKRFNVFEGTPLRQPPPT